MPQSSVLWPASSQPLKYTGYWALKQMPGSCHIRALAEFQLWMEASALRQGQEACPPAPLTNSPPPSTKPIIVNLD